MQSKRTKTPTGLRVRHSRQCATETVSGVKCTCTPSVEAWAFDKRAPVLGRDGKQRIDAKTGKPLYGIKLRKTFAGVGALAAAKTWRRDASGAVERGTLKPTTAVTLREAAEKWLEGAKAGTIRNRSGDEFKPSAVYGYERSLKLRVLPSLGAAKLSDITRSDLQDLADRLLAEGLSPSTVRNHLMPLRSIFGRATKRAELAINPTRGIDLPAVRGRRDRIVDPAEARDLLAALPDEDRALWATAIYAGLRRGELLALRWEDVDLAGGVIRVERSYDPRSGQIVAPKSAAGTRRVPVLAVLRDELDEHKLRSGGEGLVFARKDGRPFPHSWMLERAAKAWGAAAVEKARAAGASDEELEKMAPFDAPTLHEMRHSYASIMIAAGVNAKQLSTYMGHASITITLDRYGHLLPGAEDEAAALADAFLARSDTSSRLEQLD